MNYTEEQKRKALAYMRLRHAMRHAATIENVLIFDRGNDLSDEALATAKILIDLGYVRRDQTQFWPNFVWTQLAEATCSLEKL